MQTNGLAFTLWMMMYVSFDFHVFKLLLDIACFQVYKQQDKWYQSQGGE